MTKIPLGKVAFTDAGAYDAEKTFRRFDFVTTEDSCYLSLQENNTGHPVTDTDWWKCLARGTTATAAAAKAAAAAEAANEAAARIEEAIDSIDDKATKEELQAVDNKFANYVTSDELEQKGYETVAHASETYATKDEMAALNVEDLVMYGIEFDTSVSSPDCTRIGNPNLHRTLPVHSLMRGCLLNDDGVVQKYLNSSSWTAETRDGSAGQVMVEVPEHWMRYETDGNKRRVKLSNVAIAGYTRIPRYYISAYEAAVQRSASKLCSVVNTSADYRGGANQADWDGTYRTLLGRPVTSITRTNCRTYARNRKAGSTEWNCMTYAAQKDLYWLFAIEYATLNSQKAFNAAKDSNGYAQGGLGDGVSTLDSTRWSNFNGYHPFVPCGHTDTLGNGTGQVAFAMPSQYGTTLTVQVPRYRGIENPFGHIWAWTDGINVQIEPGNGLSKVYTCNDPAKFNDSNYDGYSHVGNEARTEGYVKSVIFGRDGEIMPDAVGGSSTTWFCDYHYTSIPGSTTLRGVFFGGIAHYGASAGLVCATSNGAPSFSHPNVGSRLCFYPE